MNAEFLNKLFTRTGSANATSCCATECRENRRIAQRARRRHARMMRERKAGQRALDRSVEAGSVRGLEQAAKKLARAVDTERVLKAICRPSAILKTDASGRRLDVLMSSFQLLESFTHCVQTHEEGMHFLVGYDVGNAAIVSGMQTFPYESRSVVHATGDQSATHRIVRGTHDNGHRVLAIMHGHPGTGPNANFHSARDIAGQKKWEPWNRQIGGIWSRDGYLRFFSWQLPFSVRIKGTHLEQVEDTLWRIKDGAVAQSDQTSLALSSSE